MSQQGLILWSICLLWRDNCGFQVEKYLKLAAKSTKNPKSPNFQIFYAVFVKFMTDLVDWNDENAQHGKILLSSRLFRRDNCCFLNEKNLKLKPKMTKNPKFSDFQSFYAIVVEIATDFVDWNVENGHQSKSLMCSSILWRDNSGFQVEKYLKLALK